jgi:hypothetical protein
MVPEGIAWPRSASSSYLTAAPRVGASAAVEARAPSSRETAGCLDFVAQSIVVFVVQTQRRGRAVMNGTRDIHDAATDEDAGGLDPREAARLLEQTRREAQRKFDMRSPGLSLLGAAVVLVALGAVWLSVRGQHPYKGPTAAGLVVMYGVLVCWIGVVVTVNRRAMTGLSGRSVRQQRAFGGAVVTALVAVSVFRGCSSTTA